MPIPRTEFFFVFLSNNGGRLQNFAMAYKNCHDLKIAPKTDAVMFYVGKQDQGYGSEISLFCLR